jgi:hypothetical protein
MKVPLLDLKVQYAGIKDEILCAISEVLDSQVCILGPKVAELERQIAALSDCKFGVGVSSGTDALLAALMALEIGAGDEVITTSFTFFATAGCVSRTGAKPVFVDIDPRTYNIDPRLIERAITPRTKAIIPVHLYGQMCDMDPIMEIAQRHKLYVIEDAAQAISSTYKGRKAGSIGHVGCFSFFPSKNLGGAGIQAKVLSQSDRRQFPPRSASGRRSSGEAATPGRLVGGPPAQRDNLRSGVCGQFYRSAVDQSGRCQHFQPVRDPCAGTGQTQSPPRRATDWLRDLLPGPAAYAGMLQGP